MESTSMEAYSMMQTGKPIKSYRKTILGKLHVLVLNPFSESPEGLILKGNPKQNEESCIVDVWTDKEDAYFKRANRVHFEKGMIIPFERKTNIEPSEEEQLNSMTDEEMKHLVNSKFFTLQSSVNRMTAVPPVYRMLEIAKEEEKSAKIIDFLQGKLAELQLGE